MTNIIKGLLLLLFICTINTSSPVPINRFSVAKSFLGPIKNIPHCFSHIEKPLLKASLILGTIGAFVLIGLCFWRYGQKKRPHHRWMKIHLSM